MPFIHRLKNEVLVLDNVLTEGKLSAGLPPILLNLEKPSEIIAYHREYIASGAEIITTNTRNGLPSDLKKFGAERDFERLNAAAVDLALQAGGGNVYIAGAVGGAGMAVEPYGDTGFDEAVAEYRQQILILINTGVDLLLIDQIQNLQTMRAAAIAANTVRHQIPLICFFDFTKPETDPKYLLSLATIFESLDVDCLGLSGAPEICRAALKQIKPATNLPIAVRFDIPDGNEIDTWSAKFAAEEINIIGCGAGATPEHIRIIAGTVQNRTITPRQQVFPLRIASATQVVRIGNSLPFVKIGERINPTGRRKLSAELAEGSFDTLLQDAKTQFSNQADAIDVNVGAPLVNEIDIMSSAVRQIQDIIPSPLVLDSASPEVIEAGLKMYVGKALVNSVNGKEKRLAELLPIVKKYGAAVIGLCIDEEMPATSARRLAIARNILATCLDFHIALNNLIIDPAALAIATDENSGREVLTAIRLIKEQLGLPVSLGVSNTSFGLPQRALVHNTFLAQAIGAGLDAAILNPIDEQIHDLIAAASLFVGRDPDCRNYLKAYRAKKQTEQS